MGEQPLSSGLVMHPHAETLQIGQRFGVTLPGVPRVVANDLLETAVLRHGKPPLDTVAPQRRSVQRWPVTFDDREGNFPFAIGKLGWGGRSIARRPADAVQSSLSTLHSRASHSVTSILVQALQDPGSF